MFLLEVKISGREDNARVFFDLYYLEKDIDIKDLVLQEEEVELVKWVTLDEIKEMIQNDEFLINHAEEFLRVEEILRKQGRTK